MTSKSEFVIINQRLSGLSFLRRLHRATHRVLQFPKSPVPPRYGGEKEDTIKHSSPQSPLALCRVLVALVAIMCGAAFAAPFNTNGWNNRLKITFANYRETEMLTDFPMLVMLNTNREGFAYSKVVSPKGYDIRFADARGEELEYDMDWWEPAGNSNSFLWVKLPVLVPETTYIWMYYGNAKATSAPPSYTTGSVWRPDTYSVHHFSTTNLPGTPNCTLDSAYNGYNGRMYNMEADDFVEGKIGRAFRFNEGATNDEYVWLADGYETFSNGFTVSAWVKLERKTGVVLDFSSGGPTNDGSCTNCIWVGTGQEQYGSILSVYDPNGVFISDLMTVETFYSSNEWVFITVMIQPGDGNAYICRNGRLIGSWWSFHVPFDGKRTANFLAADSWMNVLRGCMDEVRVAHTVRSPAWVKASYDSQDDPSSYAVYGTTPGSGTRLAGSIGTNEATVAGGIEFTRDTMELLDGLRRRIANTSDPLSDLEPRYVPVVRVSGVARCIFKCANRMYWTRQIARAEALFKLIVDADPGTVDGFALGGSCHFLARIMRDCHHDDDAAFDLFLRTQKYSACLVYTAYAYIEAADILKKRGQFENALALLAVDVPCHGFPNVLALRHMRSADICRAQRDYTNTVRHFHAAVAADKSLEPVVAANVRRCPMGTENLLATVGTNLWTEQDSLGLIITGITNHYSTPNDLVFFDALMHDWPKIEDVPPAIATNVALNNNVFPQKRRELSLDNMRVPDKQQQATNHCPHGLP